MVSRFERLCVGYDCITRDPAPEPIGSYSTFELHEMLFERQRTFVRRDLTTAGLSPTRPENFDTQRAAETLEPEALPTRLKSLREWAGMSERDQRTQRRMPEMRPLSVDCRKYWSGWMNTLEEKEATPMYIFGNGLAFAVGGDGAILLLASSTRIDCFQPVAHIPVQLGELEQYEDSQRSPHINNLAVGAGLYTADHNECVIFVVHAIFALAVETEPTATND